MSYYCSKRMILKSYVNNTDKLQCEWYHLTQLRSGENKWIHFPVVPIIETGEITIKFTAYSFLRTDSEEVTIEVIVSSTD